MTNNGTVNIHGKEYVTVAKRVEMAHEANDTLSITTELIQNDPVLVKATVTTKKGVFTGYSASYGAVNKPIEKQSPFEVAETSAVGRALGFAGYGVIEGIASADEMNKSQKENREEPPPPAEESEDPKVCSAHDYPERMFRGVSKTKKDEDGNPKAYYWHKNKQGQICFGLGYQD